MNSQPETLSQLIEKRGGVVVLYSQLLQDTICFVRDNQAAKRVSGSICYTLKELHVLFADGELTDPESVMRIHVIKKQFLGLEFVNAPTQDVLKPTDPRPDLVEDSGIWNRFLKIAWEQNSAIAKILYGFREEGLRLTRGNAGWVLRPEVSERCFESIECYEQLKSKWLVPYGQQITNWLARLGGA